MRVEVVTAVTAVTAAPPWADESRSGRAARNPTPASVVSGRWRRGTGTGTSGAQDKAAGGNRSGVAKGGFWLEAGRPNLEGNEKIVDDDRSSEDALDVADGAEEAPRQVRTRHIEQRHGPNLREARARRGATDSWSGGRRWRRPPWDDRRQEPGQQKQRGAGEPDRSEKPWAEEERR